MGYYSRFKVTVDPENMTDAVIKRLSEIAGYSAGSFGGSGESIKWYTCENDVQKVSAEFPLAVITVDVNGEDTGDIWRLYATGGITERADAMWVIAEMTIKRPERIWIEIAVPLAGVDVPVEVEYVLGESEDVLIERAKATLRRNLA
jgi:hypothetical protein